MHPVNGTHVGDKVIVAKRRAAFREEKIPATGVFELIADVFDIPWGEKLAFFDIYDPSTLGGSHDKIGLAAEKGGNLEHIDILSGNFDVLRRVDIGRDGHAPLSPDLGEKLTTVLHAGSAKRADGCAIGFVIRGLEDKGRALILADGMDFLGHPTHKGRALDNTGPQKIEQIGTSQTVVSNGDNRATGHKNPRTILYKIRRANALLAFLCQ